MSPGAPDPRLANYRLERLLGSGGMGSVYLARDLALDRDVAIKFIAPDKAGDASSMGGIVGISSTVGRGTTFWVELAECLAPAGADETPAAFNAGSSSVQAGRGTVLYIEDNPSNVRLLERVMQRRPGITLLNAGTGKAGIAIAHSRRPDLILLDLHLPDMHGEAVLRGLLEDAATKTIPWRC